MYFKNIPKFPGHCPIFTEVLAKKNIKQTDGQIYHVQTTKIFECDHHEDEIVPTKKKVIIKIGAFFENISVNKH